MFVTKMDAETVETQRLPGVVDNIVNDLVLVKLDKGGVSCPHKDRCPSDLKEGDRVVVILVDQPGWKTRTYMVVKEGA